MVLSWYALVSDATSAANATRLTQESRCTTSENMLVTARMSQLTPSAGLSEKNGSGKTHSTIFHLGRQTCSLPGTCMWSPMPVCTVELRRSCGVACLTRLRRRQRSRHDIEPDHHILGQALESHKTVTIKVAPCSVVSPWMKDARDAVAQNTNHSIRIVGLQETRSAKEGTGIIDDVCVWFSAP